MILRTAIALPMIALVACGPDPNEEAATTGDLSWEPCPLYYEGKDRPTAQCTFIDVPLDWDAPESDAIEVFAQRRLVRHAERQLWMLAGGPGQSAAVFETYVDRLTSVLPATDIYLYEHRGVGRSTRLSCPDQEDPDSHEGIDVSEPEWPDCLAAVEAEWDGGLQQFTIDAAAIDLEFLITQTRGSQDVFVYGGSYGTTLAHRFLQHFPDAVGGVILDSIAVDVDHRVYDAEYDAIGREFMDVCAADRRCAEELGDDPYDFALDVLADDECPGIDAPTLRLGAGAFLGDASLRGFAPALFVRADRCTRDDTDELLRLQSLFLDRPAHYTEVLYSPVLFSNIELSEQWPEPWPSVEDLEAVVDEAAFSLDLGPGRRRLLDLWPRYPLDLVAGQIAVTDTPVLMLQGDLDPLTPPWRTEALEAALSGPGQNMVRFPQGTHILLGSTPYAGGDCATDLLADFLDDPMADPVDCTDGIVPIQFTGQPIYSTLLFSDCSRWGGGCSGGSALLLLPLWGLLRRPRGRRRMSAADRPGALISRGSPFSGAAWHRRRRARSRWPGRTRCRRAPC